MEISHETLLCVRVCVGGGVCVWFHPTLSISIPPLHNIHRDYFSRDDSDQHIHRGV